MSDLLFTIDDVEIVAAEAGKPKRLRIIAYAGVKMTPPGFNELVIDLAGLSLPASLPILSDHRNELTSIIASGIATVERGTLIVTATLADCPAAEAVLALLASGVPLQASLGASPTKRRELRPNETVAVNGQQVTAGPNGLTVIERSVLKEVSTCPLSCDPTTSVSIAAKLPKEKLMTAATLNDSSDIIATERQRLNEIQAAFDGLELLSGDSLQSRADTLKSEAINASWTLAELQPKLFRLQRDDLQLAQVRASYPKRQVVRSSSHIDTSDHISAALMIKAGYESAASKCFSADVLEQSRPLRSADFKPQRGIRPSFAGDLPQLPPGGDIQHGT